MNRNVIVAIVSLLLFLVNGCGSSNMFGASNSDKQKSGMDTARKILIVYYSHSNDTREIAQMIQEFVGGELLDLQTAEQYPENHEKSEEQVKREIEQDVKPTLKPIGYDIKEYDVIFIGFPIWSETIAPPVAVFLAQNDFANKTIIPFYTHARSGKTNSVNDIQKLIPNATILSEFAANENDVKNEKNNIIKWLSEIQVGE